MEIPEHLMAVLGVLVKSRLEKPDGLSLEQKKILDHFVKENECFRCGEIGWHKPDIRYGWGEKPPWEDPDV